MDRDLDHARYVAAHLQDGTLTSDDARQLDLFIQRVDAERIEAYADRAVHGTRHVVDWADIVAMVVLGALVLVVVLR